jgi:molecular chaperone DnaK (HSP70)
MKVGIDFGTTTSTICRVTADGRIDTQGPIPSLAAYGNGKWYFGEDAEQRLAGEDRAIYPIRDVKLMLGKKSIRIGPNQLDPEEAVSKYLSYLAGRIAKGEVIEEAVIGTPVNVDMAHRQALLSAARKSGFKEVRLVYEPTSALAGAIDLSRLDERALVLVVDWGGGTLDVAVVRKDGDTLREIEVDGDVSDLGGSRMDDELVREVLQRDASLRSKVDAIDGGFDRLKQEIEGSKRNILEEGIDDETAEPWRTPSLWLRETIEVRPADVFDVIRRMADRARERIINFLHRARINPSEITHLLFAGGVCNSPIVQKAIGNEFRSARAVSTDQQPQLLTGYGAARLARSGFTVQLAAPFGVRQCDDSFCEMLPAGHGLAVGAYRVAEFMVTDVLAPEAVFDLGICRQINGESAMMSAPGDAFRSIDQLHIRAQSTPGENKANAGDLIRLFCGIDSTLAVTVYAESNLTADSVRKSLSGVPLAIRVGR